MPSQFFPAHAPSTSAHRCLFLRGQRLPCRNQPPYRARLGPHPCPLAVPRRPCPTQRPCRHPCLRPALYPYRLEQQETSPVAQAYQPVSPERCVPLAPETVFLSFLPPPPRENMSCS